jgi:hypothetical protein
MLPISSYAIVLYAALPHLIQALILLGIGPPMVASACIHCWPLFLTGEVSLPR